MKPSTATVLALLQERPDGLTPLEALEHQAGLRLGARIHELRAAGFPIERVPVPGQPYVRYRLMQPVQRDLGL